jgi:ABC-type transport system involved in multi-copper enzyme maturation permease subunit
VRQLRAELLKIRTTRTTLGLLLGMIALVLLFTLLGGLLSNRTDLARTSTQYQVLGAGAAAIIFGVLVGILLVTSEYRFGTIRPTFLYEPRRTRVVAAKAGAGLIAGAVFGIVAEALAFGIGLIILSARGIDLAIRGGLLLQVTIGTAVVAALWCAIGVGIGAIVRHQVGAVVGILAYILVVENIVFGLAPSVGRYFPGETGQALDGDQTSHLLGWLPGGALLVLYTAVIAVIGAVLTERRDVN